MKIIAATALTSTKHGTCFVFPPANFCHEWNSLIDYIPCNDSLRMRSAVITREYFPHVRVSILLGEVGTVHPGRVTAAFRVHEKFRVRNVPRDGAQRFRYEFIERQPRVVHSDLMATKRGAGTTCKIQNVRSL